jgi:hypothetical protein
MTIKERARAGAGAGLGNGVNVSNAAAHSPTGASTQATRRFDDREFQINKPRHDEPEQIWQVFLITHKSGQGENAWLGPAELARYNRDPDLFAAQYFGCASVEEYHEWVECSGHPRCGELTKSGKPCNGRIGPDPIRSVAEWREWHRSAPCVKHGGDPINACGEPPPRERRRGRYPVRDASRRCEALVPPPDHWNERPWQWGEHQCGLSGPHTRDGRRVCHIHLVKTPIAYVDSDKGGQP